MALGFPKPLKADDERLQGHETTYQASRGGYFKPTQQQREQEKVEITVERADK
ncbi:hypothetical protein JL475_24355 [Streptomyces sp. M2CJ-2]|uniref:hypothetical protein n=1 Tax=Streptomyces sp. M2CJ-2 TaxID=2803948 RepID=UPI0019281CF2|nr:hypothetical protein [Streptomyces sp. M2CJ-2]MBL3669068.1 hypothetical protein [Streptomyces sp. M2CJ-2]